MKEAELWSEPINMHGNMQVNFFQQMLDIDSRMHVDLPIFQCWRLPGAQADVDNICKKNNKNGIG